MDGIETRMWLHRFLPKSSALKADTRRKKIAPTKFQQQSLRKGCSGLNFESPPELNLSDFLVSPAPSGILGFRKKVLIKVGQDTHHWFQSINIRNQILDPHLFVKLKNKTERENPHIHVYSLEKNLTVGEEPNSGK